MRLDPKLIATLLILMFDVGCTKSPMPGGPRLKTTSVTGTVVVDGKPQPFVTVTCYPDSEGTAAIKYPVASMTDSQGKFTFSTYTSSDGLPQGKYKLTFVWKEPSMAFRENTNDKLKGAYADPKESKFDLTVIDGQATDLGLLDLSTTSNSESSIK